MIRIAFTLIVAAFVCLSAAMAFPGLHGTPQGPYVAPCDTGSISCGEAYSVTQQMISTYSGPLFQLHNGTTTLDVGFDATTKKADMTTWSAFCSGVASNCKFNKIYAQVHTTSNDVGPSKFFPGGCDTGDCRSTFQIDGATGLPIALVGNGDRDCCTGASPLEAAGSGSYIIGSTTDDAAVGINGGTNPTSVWMSGTVSRGTIPCCGGFGISHSVFVGDTIGTTFEIFVTFANSYPPASNPCTTTVWCIAASVEGGPSPYGTYSASIGDNANWMITWTGISGGDNFCNYYNGSQLNCGTGDGTTNSPTRVRIGAGGDLTLGATPYMFRSGFIANGAVSATDAATLKTNQAAFFGVTFH